MPRLLPEQIRELAADALGAAGAAPAQAQPVARAIAAAEADGLHAAGLAAVPGWCRALRLGHVAGDAVPSLLRPAPGVLLADAWDGFAQPAWDVALPKLAVAARISGVAALGIFRAYPPGVPGHWVEAVATRGLIAIMSLNGYVLDGTAETTVPPPATLAWAVPRVESPPLVVTGQPQAGDPLGLLLEILGAGVPAARWSQAVSLAGATGKPPGAGALVMVIDPEAFAPAFLSRLELLLTGWTGQAVPPPGEGIRLLRDKAAREGVEVAAATLDAIAAATA